MRVGLVGSRRLATWLPSWLEAVPDRVVILLQLLRAESELGRTEDVARLPHEGERALDLLRLEVCLDAFLVGRGIGSMRRHAVVDRDAAGCEAFGLGLVNALDQAHQLAHHVAVEPGRAEGVFGYG